MAAPICGILLAAGTATRFGSDKLLYRLDSGQAIAVAALANLRAAIPRVIAVVRPEAGELQNVLRAAGAEIAYCAQADEGMGRSLATGVQASGAVSGWIVALADMPYLRPSTIARVASALAAGAAIAAPAYAGRRGHPVGFDARFRAQLEALGGDAGARALLREHSGLVQVIDTDDPGVCRDIDTPSDLTELRG